MCIDDRPDLLDAEVMNRAGITILASNANRAAQEYAATLIGASPRQRIRMYRMNPLEVVVSVRGYSTTSPRSRSAPRSISTHTGESEMPGEVCSLLV